jgi:hypothetical protein
MRTQSPPKKFCNARGNAGLNWDGGNVMKGTYLICTEAEEKGVSEKMANASKFTPGTEYNAWQLVGAQ